jgi:hypothetical protein
MGAGLLAVKCGFMLSTRFISFSTINTLKRRKMGAGLLAVKSGFILINRIYQFFKISYLKRELV